MVPAKLHPVHDIGPAIKHDNQQQPKAKEMGNVAWLRCDVAIASSGLLARLRFGNCFLTLFRGSLSAMGVANKNNSLCRVLEILFHTTLILEAIAKHHVHAS